MLQPQGRCTVETQRRDRATLCRKYSVHLHKVHHLGTTGTRSPLTQATTHRRQPNRHSSMLLTIFLLVPLMLLHHMGHLVPWYMCRLHMSSPHRPHNQVARRDSLLPKSGA